jgi:hypothetical protein
MYKLSFGIFSLFSVFAVAAQKGAVVHTGKCFTADHKSITATYGVSTLFNVAPFIKTDAGIDNSGSFAVGPVSVLFNRALSKDISIQFGPTVMYYLDKYKYEQSPIIPGQVNLFLVGITTGFNYHFATTSVIDPYVGAAGGISYFTSDGGADQASLRLKGSVPVLYSGKVGMNVYNRKGNAWTFEVGYDYLSYVKMGYTFVLQK